MKYVKLALLLPALTLAACATSTASPDLNAAPVVDVQPSADRGVLTVLRVKTMPYALAARISVDGEEVGRLKNGQYLRVALEPGTHEVKLSFNPLSMQKGTETTVNIVAGQETPLQLDSQFSSAGGMRTGQRSALASPDILSLARACCTQIATNP